MPQALEDEDPLYPRACRPAWGPVQGVGREHRRDPSYHEGEPGARWASIRRVTARRDRPSPDGGRPRAFLGAGGWRNLGNRSISPQRLATTGAEPWVALDGPGRHRVLIVLVLFVGASSGLALLPPPWTWLATLAVREESAPRGDPRALDRRRHRGPAVLVGGFGLADVENEVPARPTTVYRIASISKPITAVAAMQLAERGAIDLDAPVQRYVPGFPEKAWPVTPRQLAGPPGRHPPLPRRRDPQHEALRGPLGGADDLSGMIRWRTSRHPARCTRRGDTTCWGRPSRGPRGRRTRTTSARTSSSGRDDPDSARRPRGDHPGPRPGLRPRARRLAAKLPAGRPEQQGPRGRALRHRRGPRPVWGSPWQGGTLVRPKSRRLMWTPRGCATRCRSATALGWSLSRFEGCQEVWHTGRQQRGERAAVHGPRPSRRRGRALQPRGGPSSCPWRGGSRASRPPLDRVR